MPHKNNTSKEKRERKITNTMKGSCTKSSFLVLGFLLLTNTWCAESQKCRPSGRVRGKKAPPGHCNIEIDSLCCVEGEIYKTYECSPPVSRQTKAYLTLNSFEKGRDGDGPSECDHRYHSDDTPVVGLSSGWFNHGRRCHHNITIRAKGRSVVAMVVDLCDSTKGCDAAHNYQPPCANNVVVASKAVWKALGIPLSQWGELDVTWSDA